MPSLLMPASPEPTPIESPRLIKRYANRKLYDTRDSCYVTLQQIATMVRDGQEVRILDNSSKQDLTKVTLAQIIYEEEKSGESSGRSIKSLRGFIDQSTDRILSSFRDGPVAKLVSPKEAFDDLHRMADDRVRGLLTSAANRVHQLQSEVGRLQKRIEELEGRLRAASKRDEDVENVE